MSRSSPSVLRIVAVLNFFADHPGQAFSLTDLVRALKMSRATCHGVLAGLVETGYLYRTTDKSYVLGPALVYVGEVAKEHFSPLQVAQPEMRAIADEFDASCIAAFRERLDVVIRERATAASHIGVSAPRGLRNLLAPQFAAPFFVSSKPAEMKAWLNEFDPPVSPEQMDAFYQGIEFTRKHGFLVSVLQVGSSTLTNIQFESRNIADLPAVTAFNLDPAKIYKVAFISAPVFDARRKVAFVISLQGVTKPCSGAEVERIGVRVRQVCDRISSYMAHAPAVKRAS